ncbi:MAG: serine hydrolase [Flavobacteriaceae bacterium]|jgi:CubicO group peptidase (beta-lactamase class C family)|nr:serine hydrolase [Flavobacteriaceae bacterium]|tara:strand:+ start:153 stop:1346 length:1194 start_codon:yes stop_codon:yes gene_type:complete
MKQFIFLLFFANSLSFSQFNEIKLLQKKLIVDEITGSNVALVYKEGSVVYFNIQNSGKIGDKNISNQSYKPYKETIFPIWSMSKPISIVATMILLERGLIKLTDNISKYIPAMKNMNCETENGIQPCENQIKIIDLLTHRSGLGYYSDPGYGYGYTNSIKYDNLEEFTNDLSEVVLKFEPGLKYFYGINQAVLGRVIEVVSNQTFFEFLKKELFDPLEMNETKFYLTKQERDRFQPLFINTGALKGFTYELNELSYKKNNEAYFGGEGLVSTLGDYSNFCKMLLNGGSYNGKKIISQNSINLMTKKYSQSYPNEEFADTRKLGFYYGFSLFVLENPEIDNTNSTKGIYGWSGYHNTHFWIDPEKQLFAIFLSRSRQGVSNIDTQKEFRRAVYKTIMN